MMVRGVLPVSKTTDYKLGDSNSITYMSWIFLFALLASASSLELSSGSNMKLNTFPVQTQSVVCVSLSPVADTL